MHDKSIFSLAAGLELINWINRFQGFALELNNS